MEETDLILRATGVTEIELTFVITLDIKNEVSTFWGGKEASASTAEIVVIKGKYFWQGVDPFGPISRSTFIEAEKVSQLVVSCVIPRLNLQASST